MSFRLMYRLISRLIVLIYWFQSLPLFVIWILNNKEFDLFYNFLTMGPIPRLPVFIIGILGTVYLIKSYPIIFLQ